MSVSEREILLERKDAKGHGFEDAGGEERGETANMKEPTPFTAALSLLGWRRF